MRILRTAEDLAAAGVYGGVFVPTMGALHDGHGALIREAAALRRRDEIASPVVVSVFVNPTQFNDRADLDRYPRTLEDDARRCREAGADFVFAPEEAAVYPRGRVVAAPPLPAQATEPRLEDRLRPGHFAGVCQVVARLFELVRPRVAVFGEKDWQQLQVILAMVESGVGVSAAARPRIVGVATVREADGLAMSSRNVFLKPDERSRAAAISRALVAAGGVPTVEDAEATMARMVVPLGLTVQYAVVRDATTLLAATPGRPCRALIAAKLGSVRLIDNAPWPWPRAGATG